MDFALARELAEAMPSKSSARKWQEDLLTIVRPRMPKMQELRSDGGQMVVVLVGPTGSGKTTTIAKLAAHYHLEQHQSVLMVTTDTFRVGAVEQLETFAGILKVPLRVANRPKEVEAVVRGSNADVVLIDTQGHSVRHSLHMAEVRSIWEGYQTAEVLLTVPATFAADEIRGLASGFLQGEPGKVVITKVDEARRPGPVLSALMTMDLAVSFVTNGQSVPEDIHQATVDGLVSWLMGGEYGG
jgi:flagellar biosynthesis protein FlhF